MQKYNLMEKADGAKALVLVLISGLAKAVKISAEPVIEDVLSAVNEANQFWAIIKAQILELAKEEALEREEWQKVWDKEENKERLSLLEKDESAEEANESPLSAAQIRLRKIAALTGNKAASDRLEKEGIAHTISEMSAEEATALVDRKDGPLGPFGPIPEQINEALQAAQDTSDPDGKAQDAAHQTMPFTDPNEVW